ncbi:phosphate ABC transporter permease PstA [Tepidiforma thermophila]|uniref:Phosphate transport system permease protein PstA n=1 Tax=Tepidiforma thermophila (strain KCTC 52669 / CGMCC 1.13589 / G233) TaxID=2761530 RepID=A0A2A9HCH4_TEPT2|nr:phosphate ABC transporter permease PstA [Tepidiforma thermophila]PFG72862.1 phosphate ABC transporter membrane protein 2 (PhoT family) [Tepidiforma thermophila]
MAVTTAEQFPAREQFRPRLGFRKVTGAIFTGIGLVAIAVGLGMLLWLLVDTFVSGLPWLDWQFLTSFDSRFPDRAGAKAAIYGTAYMMFFTIVLALPIGVMSAIYLEEYAREGKLKSFIQINISNLAAVPSIIYGLLGLQVFVRWMELGRSVLAGSLTMALLILPIIVVATQEALRAVPPSIRDASYGVGATRWETIRYHVLPYALPGILTGNILAASRAIGESAPLITIGALTYVPFTPDNPLDRFTVLPIQIFNWVSRPQQDFQGVAAAGIIVLLVVLLLMNSVAIFLRQKLQRRF